MLQCPKCMSYTAERFATGRIVCYKRTCGYVEPGVQESLTAKYENVNQAVEELKEYIRKMNEVSDRIMEWCKQQDQEN
jgi:ribosomal protein L37AE/L43A